MYDWSATKFEKFYQAYAHRKIADELSMRRALEIAAVWGNSNYDSEKDPKLRSKIMEDIDMNFGNAIAGMYDQLTKEEEEKIDESDPFWQAAKRGQEKRKLPK